MGLLLFFWGPSMVIGGKYWSELSSLTSDKSAAAYDRPNSPAFVKLPAIRNKAEIQKRPKTKDQSDWMRIDNVASVYDVEGSWVFPKKYKRTNNR
jgi:hypothetical protein